MKTARWTFIEARKNVWPAFWCQPVFQGTSPYKINWSDTDTPQADLLL